MKKLVLCAVLAAGSLTLYSFRGVEEVGEFNDVSLEQIEFGNGEFYRDRELHPDKFYRDREHHIPSDGKLEEAKNVLAKF